MGATMEVNAYVKPKTLRVSFMKAFVIYDDARAAREFKQEQFNKSS